MTKTMNNNGNLRFMDFCAGVGGGRVGLEALGMECVGFSEIDKKSEHTYRELFGTDEVNYGDLMNINYKNLPDFDLMIAGFPCQTFSVVGQRTGMKDDRGQIIFGLINILTVMKTKYFILENVKGLLNHDSGRSMKIVLNKLEEAGYHVYWKLINSLYYGVPQMRERVYFIGVRKELINKKELYKQPKTIKTPSLDDYLIDTENIEFNESLASYETFLKYLKNKYNQGKYSVEELLQENLLVLDSRQSDLRLYRGKVPTLRTGRHGILYVKDGKLRKLSGYESFLLQGFPKELASKIRNKIPEANLLSQAGNAMTVPVVKAFGELIINLHKEILCQRKI